jgi:hypothetical protein
MELRQRCVESAKAANFDELVVTGDYELGHGYRYLAIPDVTKTTLDALLKRDAGTLATVSDYVLFLSDDHAIASWNFVQCVRSLANVSHFDVCVPIRLVEHPEKGLIRIPNGEEGCYCAGHAGIFRRSVMQHTPWIAQPHHPNWDLLASRNQQAAGFKFVEGNGIAVVDLTPETAPWN